MHVLRLPRLKCLDAVTLPATIRSTISTRKSYEPWMGTGRVLMTLVLTKNQYSRTARRSARRGLMLTAYNYPPTNCVPNKIEKRSTTGRRYPSVLFTCSLSLQPPRSYSLLSSQSPRPRTYVDEYEWKHRIPGDRVRTLKGLWVPKV